MRKIKYIFFGTLLMAGMYSCQVDRDKYDEVTGSEAQGGLATINSKLVGYVVGNGTTTNYTADFSLYQGKIRTEAVEVYKSFTKANGQKSNEILLTTIPMSGATGTIESKSFNFSYNDLIAGLQVGGNPMPASDAALEVGEYWTLRYVAKTSEGASHSNATVTKVSVGTRFAGNYTVIAAEYYRIGVPRPDVAGPYIGTTIVIESVTSTLYKLNDYFGPFNNNVLYFTIDSSDVIDYPANKPDGSPQVGNSQPFISCNTTPSEMTNVHCGTSNFVTRDNVNGHDKLTMSFGYLNAPGASREFYQVLEKM